ncbi:transducin/WD40 repeat-like superfamily protein [Striga asiatica]|uniref:Transducin/WD40 repeat-like superfamily protein n=1 Tax=Striga asiatica TaxID=4170 RepID=A0A5A7PZU8_STRAF|nr:transducin/WD40 repeat-like superfamily protein [Striga asiatica]
MNNNISLEITCPTTRRLAAPPSTEMMVSDSSRRRCSGSLAATSADETRRKKDRCCWSRRMRARRGGRQKGSNAARFRATDARRSDGGWSCGLVGGRDSREGSAAIGCQKFSASRWLNSDWSDLQRFTDGCLTRRRRTMMAMMFERAAARGKTSPSAGLSVEEREITCPASRRLAARPSMETMVSDSSRRPCSGSPAATSADETRRKKDRCCWSRRRRARRGGRQKGSNAAGFRATGCCGSR